MDDRQIVALYWSRDEEAVAQTARKYERYLTKIAWDVLADREDSRECVNDTYLRAWNSMPPQRPEILSTYLGRITRHLAIDVFRRKNSAKRRASQYALCLEELEDCLPDPETPESALDGKLLAEAVRRFVRDLPEPARTAFVSRYDYFDPMGDVAACCGMSQAGLKSLLYRTRQSLRAYLVKEGFDL